MKGEIIWKTSITTTAEAEDAVAEPLATHVAPSPSAYTDVETEVTTVSAYATQPPKNISATKTALQTGLKRLKHFGLDVGSARVQFVKRQRKLGQLVEAAFPGARDRQSAARETELDQTQAEARPETRGARIPASASARDNIRQRVLSA